MSGSVRGLRNKIGVGILIMASVAGLAYLLLPEHRKAAGQILRYNERTWLVTSVKWLDDAEQAELQIRILSVWPQSPEALHHTKLKNMCNAVLPKLELKDVDSLASVSLGASLLMRRLTGDDIELVVEHGACTQKLAPVAPRDGAPKIRYPSDGEVARGKALLNRWKNIRASYSTGVRGDGMYFEFVAREADQSIEDFDFLLMCRVVLARTPETRQTQFGLMDFLGRGHFSFRVWEREKQDPGESVDYVHREFDVRGRDCVPSTDGAG